MRTGTLPAVVDADGCCRDFKLKFGERALMMTKHRRVEIAGQRLTANTSLRTFRGFVIVAPIDLDDGCRHVEKVMAKASRPYVPTALQKASEVRLSHAATCYAGLPVQLPRFGL